MSPPGTRFGRPQADGGRAGADARSRASTPRGRGRGASPVRRPCGSSRARAWRARPPRARGCARADGLPHHAERPGRFGRGAAPARSARPGARGLTVRSDSGQDPVSVATRTTPSSSSRSGSGRRRFATAPTRTSRRSCRPGSGTRTTRTTCGSPARPSSTDTGSRARSTPRIRPCRFPIDGAPRAHAGAPRGAIAGSRSRALGAGGRRRCPRSSRLRAEGRAGDSSRPRAGRRRRRGAAAAQRGEAACRAGRIGRGA